MVLKKVLCAILVFVFAALAIRSEDPPVTAPPAALGADPFYAKHVSFEGLPILGSSRASDAALREAEFLMRRMIGQRPDIVAALVRRDVRIVVMHANEMTTDLPEQRDMRPKQFWDLRARGLGGRITSTGEENLLNLPGDRYPTENILIHEFGHVIHGYGLRTVDPTFDRRLRAAFDAAKEKGLWKGTYAMSNAGEYWAEGVQSWFDTNRENDSLHNHVDTREEIVEYDPGLAELLREVFGDGEWRYSRYDIRKTGRAAKYRFLRFYADRLFEPEHRPRFIATGDVDGDGDMDIVAGGEGAIWLYETEAGGRVAEWKRWSGLDGEALSDADAALLRDVDADGDLDVVSGRRDGAIGWWRNPGAPFADGAWVFTELAAAGGRVESLATADVDGDGDATEIIATARGTDGMTSIAWYRRTAGGAGGLERHEIGRERSAPTAGAAAAGDVDRDGHVDVAFAGGWYEAPDDPSGAWTRHSLIDRLDVRTRLADIDGDGDLDLVAASSEGGVFWLEAPERPAAATSWKRHGIDAGIRPRALAAGDIDGDGDPEVVVAEFVASEKSEQAHRAFIFERAGDGSWERAELGGPSFPLGSLDAIDVSGDGRLDLIGHGFPQPVISFYENATRR